MAFLLAFHRILQPCIVLACGAAFAIPKRFAKIALAEFFAGCLWPCNPEVSR